MLSNNVNNKKCAPKLVFFNEKKNWERFGWFLTQKIDFDCQILALFDSSPLNENSKFNNFLWVCWFLGKHLSNFAPLSWKLDNPYYHNLNCAELTRNNLPFQLPHRKFKWYVKLQNTFLTYEDSIKIFLQIGECPDVFLSIVNSFIGHLLYLA